ncbi:hypothetical protein REPUB_Repub17cG0009100 [Reevesia pubescens]
MAEPEKEASAEPNDTNPPTENMDETLTSLNPDDSGDANASLQLCLKDARVYGYRFLSFLVWTMQVMEPALSDMAARFTQVEFVKIDVDELLNVE